MIQKWLRHKSPKSHQDYEGQVVTTEHDLSSVANRLLLPDGSFNVERCGHDSRSLYHFLMNTSWWSFLLWVFFALIIINFLFAFIFVEIGVVHIGATPSSFIENLLNAFYFSVQTFTTLGYGVLSPDNHLSNIVASLDSFIGIMTAALLTGLFFARFAKPRSYMTFSNKILIAPNLDGEKSLQCRVVNRMREKVIDLEARATMTWLEKDGNRVRRRFKRLELEVDRIFLFPLNWTLVHHIDKDSPLYGLDEKSLQEKNIEILYIVKGFDETYSAIIHSDRSYQMSDLVYGAKFQPMYTIMQEETLLDLDKLDAHEPYQF